MLLRVLRIFRLLRILRLLKSRRAKGVRDLLMTLVLSAPALVNISSLLGLLMGMYSVLGVQLFTYFTYGEVLTEDRNFESFGSGLLLLFQVLTGDDWAALMDDCMVTPENSDCTLEAGNCGSPAAIPFFVSYQLIGSFVLLNLVVAVILENFTTLGNVNPDLISSSDIANFTEAWSEYDPDADGDIAAKDLPTLLLKIPPPMGFKGKTEDEAEVKAFCKKLTIPKHMNAQGILELKFQEVIDALVQANFAQGNAIPGSSAGLAPELAERAKHAASLVSCTGVGMAAGKLKLSSPGGNPISKLTQNFPFKSKKAASSELV